MNFEIAVHEGPSGSCGGAYEAIGVPKIRWWEPKDLYIMDDPALVGRASYLPEAVHLIRCKRCKEIETLYFTPGGEWYKIDIVNRRNLPIHKDWRSAYYDTPQSVIEDYFKAHRRRSDPENFTDGLVACRRALEQIVSDVERQIQSANDRSTLFARINKLQKSQVLPGMLGSVAQNLRRLSNPGAHDGRPMFGASEVPIGSWPLESEMEIALHHLEALISHLYVSPAMRRIHAGEPDWKHFLDYLEQTIGR